MDEEQAGPGRRRAVQIGDQSLAVDVDRQFLDDRLVEEARQPRLDAGKRKGQRQAERRRDPNEKRKAHEPHRDRDI